MTSTEFVVRARLAQLGRRTGTRLAWEHQRGVYMIRSNGVPIGTLTSLASVETFLNGYERALDEAEAQQGLQHGPHVRREAA